MGKRFPKSLLFLRGFSLCLYTCVYLALAGQSSCSGTGTKTFGNAPGSSKTSSSGAVTVGAPTGSFAGLQSVVSSSFTNAVISVGSFTGSISKIEVFCAYGPSPSPSLAPPAYTSVGTYIPNASNQINLSPIYSGTTHTCYGLPETLSGTEVIIPDARVSVTFKTLSFNQVAYRNVVNARAFGATVNPAASPTARMVDITWQPFSNSQLSATPLPNTQTYAVYRTLKGTFPDVSSSGASANCAASQASGTCKVNCASGSTLSGLFSVRCIDLDVAAAPAKYWYYISTLTSVNASPRPEEYPNLPSVSDSPQTLPVATYPKVSSTITPSNQAYLVNVPIPPGEMVLVHRDSANFEFCNLIQKSNQLDTFAAQNGVGHLFHNRCLFNGLGARPVNTNPYGPSVTIPGVASGIQTYDFGYNLFIDRYEAGCNWTPASQGGMCGPGQTSGDCVGQAVQSYVNTAYAKPRDDIGINGNVFLATTGFTRVSLANGNVGTEEHGATCWIKINNSWTIATEAIPAMSSSLARTLYTPAPVNDLVNANASLIRPPLIVNQSGAATVCSAQAAPGYTGFAKRLVRRREFMAASAWPTNQFEAQSLRLSPTQINLLRSSSAVSVDVNFSRAGCFQPFYDNKTASQYISPFPTWYVNGGRNSSLPNPSANNRFNSLVDLTSSAILSPFSSNSNLLSGFAINTLGFFVANSAPGNWDGYGFLGSGPGVLATGSSYSKNCVSRYGAQDLLGNIGEWNAEEMICDSTGCKETTSRFDDGASLGSITFDGTSGQGPLLKNPNWFLMGATTGIQFGGDAYNVRLSASAPSQPVSRSLASATATSGFWMQSQFQVMSIGPTPVPVASPGDTLSPGTKVYTSYFHPALGLPAQDSSNETIDSAQPLYATEFLGVKSFSVMNGTPNALSSTRIGLISGSPVSDAMAFKPNGTADTMPQSTCCGNYPGYAFVNGPLASHATRWAPIFEHENGINSGMFFGQPAKGFRCSFSPDLSIDP